MLKNECRNMLRGPLRCHIKTLLMRCELHNEVLQATSLKDDRSKIIHLCIRHQRKKEGETPHIKPFQHGRYIHFSYGPCKSSSSNSTNHQQHLEIET